MWLAVSTLSLVLAGNAPPFMTVRPNWPDSFNGYCDSVHAAFNADTDGPLIDPTHLPNGAQFFTLPTVDEVLGQKVAAASRRVGEEGTLGIGLVVNLNRRASFVRVLESTNSRLDKEAKSIIESSKFTPAWLDGNFVSSCMFIKVTFKIK
jgi:hypothetical protein